MVLTVSATLSNDQIHRFHRDGFVIVPNFAHTEHIQQAKARFEPLFEGLFETGIQPDEWNWRSGDDTTLTRQICNGWKSDRAIARLVLNVTIGQYCTMLMDWPGARINQDNVIWKPPGAKALGFHQDDSYQNWIEPASMISCWVALDDTHTNSGSIEYAKGSHQWPVQTEKFTFHAPKDYHGGLRMSAHQIGVEHYDIEIITIKAGDAVFHHGRTWHGSGANCSEFHRRAVVAHCMSSEASYHPTNNSPIYSRYRRFDSNQMDESFFPILYTRDGYSSPFIHRYCQ